MFTITLVPTFLSLLPNHSPVHIDEGIVVPIRGLKAYVGRERISTYSALHSVTLTNVFIVACLIKLT